jgi:hypothetical protein
MPTGIPYATETLLIFQIEKRSVRVPQPDVANKGLRWLYALLPKPYIKALIFLRAVASATGRNNIATFGLSPMSDGTQMVVGCGRLSAVSATPAEVLSQQFRFPLIGNPDAATPQRGLVSLSASLVIAVGIMVTIIAIPAWSAFAEPHRWRGQPLPAARTPGRTFVAQGLPTFCLRGAWPLPHIGAGLASAIVSERVSGIACKGREWFPGLAARAQVVARLSKPLVFFLWNAQAIRCAFKSAFSVACHVVPRWCFFTVQYKGRTRPCQTSPIS